MDVTQANFDEQLEAFREALPRAAFAAIDCEFTGLWADEWFRSTSYDSLEVRYRKLRDSATAFGLLQYGIALFEYDAEERTLIARPWNFWVRPAVSHRTDASGFRCQMSSLEFLAEHGFSMDKWVRESVPFMSKAAVEARRAIKRSQIEGRSREKEGVEIKADSDRQWLDDTLARIRAWRARFPEGPDSAAAREGDNVGDDGSAGADKPANGGEEEGEDGEVDEGSGADGNAADKRDTDPKEMIIEPVNAFLRRALHEAVDRLSDELNDVVVESISDGARSRGAKEMRVTRLPGGIGDDGSTPRERFTREAQVAELAAAMAEADALSGFSSLIELLSESKVPVVGHNCVLDLFHTAAKFHGSLPETAEEFVRLTNGIFPTVYDTKSVLYLVDALREATRGGRDLGAAFSVLSRDTKVKATIAEGFDRYRTSDGEGLGEAAHEAGYDAYMTGVVFGIAAIQCGVPFDRLREAAPADDSTCADCAAAGSDEAGAATTDGGGSESAGAAGAGVDDSAGDEAEDDTGGITLHAPVDRLPFEAQKFLSARNQLNLGQFAGYRWHLKPGEVPQGGTDRSGCGVHVSRLTANVRQNHLARVIGRHADLPVRAFGRADIVWLDGSSAIVHIPSPMGYANVLERIPTAAARGEAPGDPDEDEIETGFQIDQFVVVPVVEHMRAHVYRYGEAAVAEAQRVHDETLQEANRIARRMEAEAAAAAAAQADADDDHDEADHDAGEGDSESDGVAPSAKRRRKAPDASS